MSWSGGRESSPELLEGRRVGEGEDGGGNTTADMQSQHMAKMCSSGGIRHRRGSFWPFPTQYIVRDPLSGYLVERYFPS